MSLQASAPPVGGDRAAPAAYESPELIDLFRAYTASPTSIGAHFVQQAARTTADHPLIVATGTDLALFPGGRQPPEVMGYRLSTRGFKELAAVSHLGPALSTLARMKQVDERGPWREDAESLLASTRRARLANSVELWRDRIAVGAYVGREAPIAAMVDYACALTERQLERALTEPDSLTAANLRREFLEGPSPELAVPINRVMVATFFLTGMDLAHRLIRWCDGHDLLWERTMVIIAGRQGRPTSGVTVETNSVAGVVHAASRGRLPRRHLIIAPHAPVFPTYDGSDREPAGALEADYRGLWSGLLATSDLGAEMFDGYPPYEARPREDTRIDASTVSVSEMPTISAADDWLAMTTRLRIVMEDSRQLLSGAVTDFASRQLVDNDNDPARVTVPGLDGEPYAELER